MIINKSKFNKDWNTKSLDELGEFNRGKSKHRPRNDIKLFSNGKYPLVQTGDITRANFYINSNSQFYNDFGLSQSKIWEKDTLCITIAANIAETALLGYPMCFPDSVVGFQADNDVTSQIFTYYIFKFIKETIQRQSSGSSQKNINIDYLKKLRFKIPELNTQKQIAKVLSDLDAKIEVNNKINQELEAMAKTLYDYWFVQFDFPTSARYAATVGKPEMEGKPYKSSGGKMVFNEELKREIPEGWGVKKLKEIAKTGSGGTPLKSKNEYYQNGTIPWINSGEVNDPFIVSASKFINESGLKESSAKLFGKGTILMAMYGATAGKVSLIDLEACTNQAICAIIPNRERLKYYIKFSLEDLYKYLVNLSSGSARDNLSQDKIKQLNLVLPNKTLLQKFHENICPMMDKILVNMKENQKLAELRDWLLPMLMNGQATVKRSVAEREMEKRYAENEGELGMVAEEKLNI